MGIKFTLNIFWHAGVSAAIISGRSKSNGGNFLLREDCYIWTGGSKSKKKLPALLGARGCFCAEQIPVSSATA